MVAAEQAGEGVGAGFGGRRALGFLGGGVSDDASAMGQSGL